MKKTPIAYQETVPKKKETSKLVNQLLVQNETIRDDIINRQSWNELDQLRDEITNAVVTIAQGVNESISLIKANSLKESKELVLAVNTIHNDFAATINLIKQISVMHEGRDGPVQDGEELAIVIDIYNQYYIAYDQFSKVAVPNLIMITEYITEQNLLNKENSEPVTENTTEVIAEETTKESVND